jgi:hypothetical protein
MQYKYSLDFLILSRAGIDFFEVDIAKYDNMGLGKSPIYLEIFSCVLGWKIKDFGLQHDSI